VGDMSVEGKNQERAGTSETELMNESDLCKRSVL
jgi:hypothetical protein